MKCLICNSKMKASFEKAFDKKRWGFQKAEYKLCEKCGFSACQTHFDMSDSQWSKLNIDFHTSIYDVPGDPFGREDRLKGQATAIRYMLDNDLLPENSPMIDWGSGLGDLANRLMQKQVHIYSYDKYIKPFNNPLPENKYKPRSFSLVTSCAVMEHLRDRESLNEIEELVADDGVLGVHMAIPNKIPVDPSWVYLLPVHCSFYTSRSMLFLMKQWSYECAIYCKKALMWFFFKNKKNVLEKVITINKKHGGDFFYYGDGYVTPQGIELRLDQRKQPSKVIKLYRGNNQILPNWINKTDKPAHFIYTDNLIETMTLNECKKYMKESYDSLAEGGVHRVTTIDLQKHIDLINNGKTYLLEWVRDRKISTSAEFLNTLFKDLGFKYLYDVEMVKKIMAEAGFRNIMSLEKDKSRFAMLRNIDRKSSQLYIEAVK